MTIYRKLLVFIVSIIANQFVFASICDDINTSVIGEGSIGVTHTGDGDVIIHKTSCPTIGIPEEVYDQLSEKYHVTKSALKSFFKILEQKQVPSEDLDSTLREIAKRYKELLAKVDTLKSNDEAIKLLITQAKQALENGEFDKAESLFNQAKKQSIESAKRRLALIKEQQAIAEQELLLAAESAAANGQLKESQLAYEEVGDYYQEAADLLPTGNEEIFVAYLEKVVDNYYLAGKYRKVLEKSEKLLKIKEEIFGSEDIRVATSMTDLALILINFSEYERSSELQTKAIEMTKKLTKNENHPNIAKIHNGAAKILFENKKYKESLLEYSKAIDIYRNIEKGMTQNEHEQRLDIQLKIAYSLNGFARTHSALGAKEEVIRPLLQESLEIRENVWTQRGHQNHPDIAIAINSLGMFEIGLKKCDNAAKYFEMALDKSLKSLGKEHPDIIKFRVNVCAVHECRNDGKTLGCFRKVLETARKILDERDPMVTKLTRKVLDLEKNYPN